MGMGVPLLNEYKRSFVFKRIPQTVLGGLKLKLGYSAPVYVYINQVVLWLVPLLLGCIFTVVLELAYTDGEISDLLLLYTCLYGGCIIIFVVVVQTISTVVEMKEKENLQHVAATGRGGIALMQKKVSHLLADEDQVDFESCCGAETLAFVVPPKKFKINIALHALLSGVVCGVGFWYLLPYTLNKLYGHNYGVTAVLFLLGWVTVCIAQYALTTTAPPEPAVYSTMDAYEILPLTRPLYVLICYAVHIANWYTTDWKRADQILHAMFAALPLLWTVGLLPPAQVFFLWLLEQMHVWLLGGSPTVSTPRLVIHCALGASVFVGCYFLGSVFASALLAAGAGYLLSCDLGSLGSQIWSLWCHRGTNRVSTKKASPTALSFPHPSKKGFLWSWVPSTVLYHALMLLLATGLAAVGTHKARSLTGWWRVVGYGLMALCVVEKLLRDSQSVFGGMGLWRNCLYPANVNDSGEFRRQKGRLVVLGIIRRCLVTWVCPLLTTFYLGLLLGADSDVMDVSLSSGKSHFKAVCFVLGVVRMFRWSWQNTTHAMLEVALVHAILIGKPTGWDNLEPPVLLLVTSLVRDRLTQVANKLFFWLAVLVSSWTDKKQRRSSTGLLIVLNIIFFPVVLVVIVAASILSAPLLCVFTLPVFFIGFPRPVKFWSEPVGLSASSCPDSLFYRQLSMELAGALSSAYANGSLGDPQPGTHYLARFQDRLVWLMVLEKGAAFLTLSVKGLELQETSCHTAEAARIDDQFSEAFAVPHSRAGFCRLNNYPAHCLTPLDVVQVHTYSDAKNVLTGVIDVPGAVETTLTFFTKTLVWLLLHHINKRKKEEEEARRRKEKEIAELEGGTSSEPSGGKRKSSPPNDPGKGGGRRRGDKVNPDNLRPFKGKSSAGVVVRPPPPPFEEHTHSVMTSLPPIIPGNRTSLVYTHQSPTVQHNPSETPHTYTPAVPRPPSQDSHTSSVASLHSYTDIFSDDELGAGDGPGKKMNLTQRTGRAQRQEMSSVVTITHKHPNPLPPSPTFDLRSLPSLVKPFPGAAATGETALNDSGKGNDIDDLFSETDFGLPAVDVNKPHAWPKAHSAEKWLPPLPSDRVAAAHTSNIFKPVMNLAGSPDFKCQYSSHISIPHKWRELPIEPSQLSRHINQFPTLWYRHVLSTLDWSAVSDCKPGNTVVAGVANDDTLTNCYSQLVMACYLAFDSAGFHSGPNYLYKCYNGDVPWNAMMDWLSEDKELHTLVITAFRYSFKLMLDQTLLGDICDGEELEECLTSLHKDWYIGRETDPEWGAAVNKSKGNLFSLGYSQAQNVYTSRTLTLQPMWVSVGRVSPEAVSGQWANLNLELLYMTNDDEERYSIQAQPALLRNLTVQAADPPLGYPIFSSPPISIPTL